jgi:competence protein ComEC
VKQDNVAKRLLMPTDKNIHIRVVTLYVGQGDCTILFLANVGRYETVLVDINLDRANGGVDVPRVLKDILGSRKLRAFINTHPHFDHLNGIEELAETVGIRELLHIGYKPAEWEHGECYDDLNKVIREVKQGGGSISLLEANPREKKIGDVRYRVLSPTRQLRREVNDLSKRTEYRRMHELSAVLKFGQGKSSVLLVGDANDKAFEHHIVPSQKEHLSSGLLSASHHGSRKFFWKRVTVGDPYLEAFELIDPTHVVVSAPLAKDSAHEHPHPEPMDIYKKKVGKNLFHTGANQHNHIFDIYRDGTVRVSTDKGELTKAYALTEDSYTKSD